MAGKGLAVITGGSSGIGYQLARIAVEEGYSLVICAHGDNLDKAAEQLRRLGGEVDAVRAGSKRSGRIWRGARSSCSSPMPALRSAIPSSSKSGRMSPTGSTSMSSRPPR